jgi:hypothetical protein
VPQPGEQHKFDELQELKTVETDISSDILDLLFRLLPAAPGYQALQATLVFDTIRGTPTVKAQRAQELSQTIFALLERPDTKAVLVPVTDNVHFCGVLVPKDLQQPWLHIDTFKRVVSLLAELAWHASCCSAPCGRY